MLENGVRAKELFVERGVMLEIPDVQKGGVVLDVQKGGVVVDVQKGGGVVDVQKGGVEDI